MLEKLSALSKLTKLTIWGTTNFIIALVSLASLLPGPLIDFNKPDKTVLEALINVSEVKVAGGKLEPFQVTITNNGNQEITPRLEISVTKKRTTFCSDSIVMDSTIPPQGTAVKDISLDCSFEEPEKYMLSINMFDQDLNPLDSADRSFVIKQVCELSS
jgi:hypothetical protein